MKMKKTILAIFFLGLAVITYAQPLPPMTPGGSPVPAEGMLALLPMALAAYGVIKLKKENRKP